MIYFVYNSVEKNEIRYCEMIICYILIIYIIVCEFCWRFFLGWLGRKDICGWKSFLY